MKTPPSSLFRFPLLALTAAILASGFVRGATDPYAGPIWALLDEKKVLTDAADITQSMYPNCDEATVEEKSPRITGRMAPVKTRTRLTSRS